MTTAEHSSKTEETSTTRANTAPPTLDNTCAVFITYHPDADFCNHVRLLQNQIPKAIIIDNHSNAESIAVLRNFAEQDSSCTLLINDENLGVATALNQAAAEARRQGYNWIITFDQDSVCEPLLWQTLTSIYTQYPHSDKIALIGSNYISTGTGRPVHRFTSADPVYAEVPMCITSASLTSLNALEQVGGFRDEYFIDAVDTEVCFRFRVAGFSVLRSTAPLILHSIGNQVVRKIFGLSVCTSDHSAQRRYYMTRNRILLARKYLFREFRSVSYDLFNLIEQIIMLILFEQDKWTEFRGYGIGLLDGLRTRTGRRNL